ncbi:MAG TPA: AMP-binding protein, partial [Acidimicrobiales bacterium]|nr:AMP-binding protein [Acidimicrobiales bacterium]
ETVVAVVGGLMAGVPVVPVPPDAGPMERDHILNDSGAAAVLGGEGWPVDVAASADFHPRVSVDPGRTAMVVYTSGTTGLPKGVMLSAAAIATDLDLLAQAWEWTADDVLAHGLPLFHVHGLILGVLGPLRVGSPLVHTGRPTPSAYAEAGASLYFGVPTVWSRVAAEPAAAAALRGARLLVSGSAGLPVPVFERLREAAGQGPIERYGMTETLITVSGRPSGERRPGWVGHPLPGVQTRLMDEDGRPVPADGESVGELEVLTPTVMSGYLNRPDDTATVMTSDGWLRSGDVACIDPDGWHRIVGRQSTDLIKSGGYRIGAGEVEAALLSHPGVREAAVIGAPDDDLGQVVVAYVVAERGVTGPDLSDFVAGRLSVHKRPRRVVLVDGLPRNAMGKVQKKLLAG